MAIRTTAVAVRAVLGRDYDDENSPDLSPYCESASSVVDDVVAKAAADGITISTTKAELIARWLAAHDYCLSDRLFASRNELGAGGSFQGQTGMGLDYTPYGQRARMFDPSGWLEALANGSVATVDWLGKPASSQLSYTDRNG